jgi:hypothetical protein
MEASEALEGPPSVADTLKNLPLGTFLQEDGHETLARYLTSVDLAPRKVVSVGRCCVCMGGCMPSGPTFVRWQMGLERPAGARELLVVVTGAVDVRSDMPEGAQIVDEGGGDHHSSAVVCVSRRRGDLIVTREPEVVGMESGTLALAPAGPGGNKSPKKKTPRSASKGMSMSSMLGITGKDSDASITMCSMQGSLLFSLGLPAYCNLADAALTTKGLQRFHRLIRPVMEGSVRDVLLTSLLGHYIAKPANVAAVAAACTYTMFQQGSFIYVDEEPSDNLYIVVDGSVAYVTLTVSPEPWDAGPVQPRAKAYRELRRGEGPGPPAA